MSKFGETHVCGSGDGQRPSPVLQGEDLSGDHPSKWSPGRRKEEDVDADKCNARFLRSDVVHDDGAGRVLACGQGSEHRHEELGGGHAYGAPEQQRSATEFIDGVQAGKGREHVDNGRDDLNDKGVLDSRILEILCSWEIVNKPIHKMKKRPKT